jgi:hypothetical protein
MVSGGFSSFFSKLLSRRKPDPASDDKDAVKERLKRLNGRKQSALKSAQDAPNVVVSADLLERVEDDTLKAKPAIEGADPPKMQSGSHQSMRASLVNLPFFSLLKSEELHVEEASHEIPNDPPKEPPPLSKPMASDRLAAMRRLETQNRLEALSLPNESVADLLAEVNRYPAAAADDLDQLPHIHQARKEDDNFVAALLLTQDDSDDAFVIQANDLNDEDVLAGAQNLSEKDSQIGDEFKIESGGKEEAAPPLVSQSPLYTLHVEHEQVGFFDASNLLNLRINQELARNQDKSRRLEIESGPNELRNTLASKRQKQASRSQQALPTLPENPVTPKRRSEQETTLQLNRLELGGEKLSANEILENLSPHPPKRTDELPGRFDKFLLAEQIDLPKKSKDTVFINQWDCTPDLTLTADGVLKKSVEQEGQNQLGLEKSGVEEIFVDFDTTANLPDRTNPFEKFSESSLILLAANPRTPARILSWLASHFNHEIRVMVARNRSALPETIWLLAKDYDESVRLAIAEHLESDRAVLKSLCDDASPLVAWRAKNTLYLLKSGARTHNNLEPLPTESLHSTRAVNPFRVLTDGPNDRSGEPDESDEEMAFLKVIAQKSSTPPRRLAELAKHANKEIRAMVAENANSPLETLWFLSRDRVADVKLKLTENYNCPIEIIEALQDDKDSYVSWQARNILSKLMGEFYPGVNLPEEPTNPRLLHSR